MAGLSSTFKRDEGANRARVIAGALAWWRDAGVEGAVSAKPIAWLDRPAPVPLAPPAPPVPAAISTAGKPAAPVQRGVDLAAMPSELTAFREWFGRADLPGASTSAQRAVGDWAERAEAAVVIAMPTRSGALLEPAAERLLNAMLRAIGLSPAACSLLPVTPAAAGARLGDEDATALRPVLLRHLSLTGARRVLLLGEGPARAMLGQGAPAARGRWHPVNQEGANMAAVVTLDLATLLGQPACKPVAWDDLLLFSEGPPP